MGVGVKCEVFVSARDWYTAGRIARAKVNTPLPNPMQIQKHSTCNKFKFRFHSSFYLPCSIVKLSFVLIKSCRRGWWKHLLKAHAEETKPTSPLRQTEYQNFPFKRWATTLTSWVSKWWLHIHLIIYRDIEAHPPCTHPHVHTQTQTYLHTT